MQYLTSTPHCGRYCWRALDGRERHHHAGVKISRRRKQLCKAECCRTPANIERARLKERLRDDGW